MRHARFAAALLATALGVFGFACGQTYLDGVVSPSDGGGSACDDACEAEEACVDLACASPCGAGTTPCSGSCVDLQSSRGHCGACGNACPPSMVCSAGHCVLGCNPGQIMCGAGCIAPCCSNLHCGTCGNVCTGGRVCVDGQCK